MSVRTTASTDRKDRKPLALGRVALAAAALAASSGFSLAQAPSPTPAPTTPAVAPANPDPTGKDLTRTETVLKKYLLGKNNLAIEGYDPVAYYPEGDPKGKGAAIKGDKAITHTHAGVLYYFSSTKNRDLFKANPSKYEPTHGGWCAYAMSKDTYTEPSPKNFKVENGRLLLFYKDIFTDTEKLWEKEGPEKLIKQADAFWKQESGEAPRVPAKDS